MSGNRNPNNRNTTGIGGNHGRSNINSPYDYTGTNDYAIANGNFYATSRRHC